MSAPSAADNLEHKFISTIKQEKYPISLLGLSKHCGVLDFFTGSQETGGEVWGLLAQSSEKSFLPHNFGCSFTYNSRQACCRNSSEPCEPGLGSPSTPGSPSPREHLALAAPLQAQQLVILKEQCAEDQMEMMLNTICSKMRTAAAENMCIITCKTGQMKEWDAAVLTWLFFKSERGQKCGAVRAVKSQGFSFIFSLN